MINLDCVNLKTKANANETIYHIKNKIINKVWGESSSKLRILRSYFIRPINYNSKIMFL